MCDWCMWLSVVFLEDNYALSHGLLLYLYGSEYGALRRSLCLSACVAAVFYGAPYDTLRRLKWGIASVFAVLSRC